MKVYCLYDDGQHIDCFNTYAEAEEYAIDGSNRLSRHWDIEAEDYTDNCDCGSIRIDHVN